MESGLLESVIGALMVAVSVPIVANWRSAAERYSDVVDALMPTLPRPRFLRPITPEEQWRRLVRQNRIIFAGIGCLGVAFLIGGALSIARHI